MKSSIVYAAVTLRTFVRFETGIWPSTVLKKSWEIFWPRLSERKRVEEYLVVLLVVQESFERYSCLEFILKNIKHCEAGLKLKLTELKVLFHDRIFLDTSLSIHVFVNKNVLWSVSLNYISCLDCLSRSFSYRFADYCSVWVVHKHRMQEYSTAARIKWTFRWCFKSKMQRKIQVWCLAKFRSGRVDGWFWKLS